MDEKKETEAQVNDVEVEPLSDDALESVAGGLAPVDNDGSSSSCCSCSSCS